MSKDPSYYERNADARKAYQRAYYAQIKGQLRRQREIDGEIRPEKVQKRREYQRNYYLANREKLLNRKREQYRARKQS